LTPVAATRRERRLAYLAWITICIVWGTTYLAIRVALESLPVALLAGLRWILASVILLIAMGVTKQVLPPFRTWGSISVASFLMIVLGNGGVVWAEQYVASGLTAVIIAMVPFWTVLVEAVLKTSDPPDRRTMIGLAVGFAGIVVLVWPELFTDRSGGRWFVAGVLALQVACVGWAVGTAYTKRNIVSSSPLATSAMQMLAAGIMFMVLGTAMGEWSRLTFTARSLGAVVYLAIAGSVVAYSAYVYALKYLPVSTVSLYTYVNPLIAVVLGSLLLAEPFSSRTLAASALVFAGIALVRTAPARRPAPTTTREVTA
jgi:drug/metabolite transporter (DMT)-like permease